MTKYVTKKLKFVFGWVENIMGKGENADNQIFSFFHLFSIVSKSKIVILTMFNLLSANALNLVMSKILSFGKGLMDNSKATVVVAFPPYLTQ